MKSFIYTFLLVLIVIFGIAQQLKQDSIQHELIPSDWRPPDLYIGKLDSLHHELIMNRNDTLRLHLTSILWEYYIEIKPDSALYFGKQHLILARKFKLKLDEANALNRIGI